MSSALRAMKCERARTACAWVSSVALLAGCSSVISWTDEASGGGSGGGVSSGTAGSSGSGAGASGGAASGGSGIGGATAGSAGSGGSGIGGGAAGSTGSGGSGIGGGAAGSAGSGGSGGGATALWSRSLGGNTAVQMDVHPFVRLDGAGNPLIVAQFNDVYDNAHLFVKYDALGNLLWKKESGGYLPLDWTLDANGANEILVAGNGGAYDPDFVAKLDPAGATIWVASIESAFSVLGARFVGAGDVLVHRHHGLTRLDADGNALWTRDFAACTMGRMALDQAENIFVVGSCDGAADLGAGPFVATKDQQYAAKFDVAGNYLWSTVLVSGAFPGGISSVAADASGNLVVAGDFFDSIDLDGQTLVSQGEGDAFLTELGPAGDPLWGVRIGGPGSDHVSDVAFDGADVVISGSFHDTIDLGGGPLDGGSQASGFLAKLSGAGAHVWSQKSGPLATKSHLRVLPGDSIVLGRTFYECGGQPGAPGCMDISRYAPAGPLLSSRQFGPATLGSLEIDADGSIVIAGGFSGVLDLGNDPLVSPSNGQYYGQDGFIAKLAPE